MGMVRYHPDNTNKKRNTVKEVPTRMLRGCLYLLKEEDTTTHNLVGGWNLRQLQLEISHSVVHA